MRLKSAHSALVVLLAVLLTHGMAYGQKDEVSHGPATNTTGRNAAAYIAETRYTPFPTDRCYQYDPNDSGCRWSSCGLDWTSTCGSDELQIETDGCGSSLHREFCCPKGDEVVRCNCGECCYDANCASGQYCDATIASRCGKLHAFPVPYDVTTPSLLLSPHS
jgi:hypothetical protein